MLRKFQKTLSVGLGGLLALGIGIGVANATCPAPGQAPNVLHEMVPHVVLPETIQYNKTVKNAPGVGYSGALSPYVATYVAYPSYQVPSTTVFRPVGQSVYPVSPASPPQLPAPQPKTDTESATVTAENFVPMESEGEDIVLSPKVNEPIRLASNLEGGAPALPIPNGAIAQTGVFCQHPASPPSAWAFSSPLFKVASVPAGWGGQTGGIVHSSPRGSMQQAGFQPGGMDPAAAGAGPQGIPYSTFQMGQMQNMEPQVQVLPNGMILLTLPPSHSNCGLLRCKSGSAPRTMLLPPAGYGFPGMMPAAPQPQVQPAAMSGAFGAPYMQVAQQSPMMMPQMMPQMQTVPMMAMTPMGPTLVGYQQVPVMNPMMNPMMNQMADPMAMMNPQMQQLQQIQQMQMAVAVPNPPIAAQVTTEAEGDTLQQPAVIGADAATNPMAVVATPFGYAIQVPADALQGDAAAQLAQMQQALMQSQMPMQMPMQMPTNPYAGLYATPFGYMAMNQSAGQGFGQPAMMSVGYSPMGMSPMGYSPMGMSPMGMSPMGMPMAGQGMSVSDMLQIMAFIQNNSSKKHRGGLAERLAERRENRRESAANNDPFSQLMQAWSTPYVTPDTTLKMPSRNAYPYGYFGVQASPVGTANYGGYHNLYYGNATYPGLY
jgi:hypothetical protein